MQLRHLTNDQLFQVYDQDLVLRLHNAKNLSDTRKILAKFKEYLNGYPPSPQLAKGFLSQYANRAPRTLYRYTQMLRVFFKWYGEELDVKIKVPKSLPSYTEDKDIEKLFYAIEHKRTHKNTIVRDSLMVALALKSGMRRGELANLQAKDVHPDFVVVRNGKGGKDRAIPLSPTTAGRLNNFVATMQPEEKVFKLKAPCITMKVKAFARKAGLDNFHCHSARHKYATTLLERGVNIRQVQQLLGHESLSTTQIYLSIVDSQLASAVKVLDDDHDKPQPPMGAESLTITVPRLGKKQTKQQQRRAEELEKELCPELFGGRKYVKSVSVSPVVNLAKNPSNTINQLDQTRSMAAMP